MATNSVTKTRLRESSTDEGPAVPSLAVTSVATFAFCKRRAVLEANK